MRLWNEVRWRRANHSAKCEFEGKDTAKFVRAANIRKRRDHFDRTENPFQGGLSDERFNGHGRAAVRGRFIDQNKEKVEALAIGWDGRIMFQSGKEGEESGHFGGEEGNDNGNPRHRRIASVRRAVAETTIVH
jgi:hypothetical protein